MNATDRLLASIRRSRIDEARAALIEAPNWGERLTALDALGADGERPFLDAWSSQGDAIGLLVSGAWHRRRAGVIRTTAGQELSTTAEWDRLRHADAADAQLFRAAELDPTNPLPWHLLLEVAAFHVVGQSERELRFAELCRRAPGDVEGHLRFAHVSSSRWGGDDDRLWRWAAQIHTSGPPGSPLRAVGAVAWTRRLERSRDASWVREHRPLLLEMAHQSVLDPAVLAHPLVDVVRALEEFAVALHLANARPELATVIEMSDGLGLPWTLWPWAHLADSWEPVRRTATARVAIARRPALA